MAKELMINAEECTGCELCVQLCPDVFEMAENVAKIVNQSGAGESEIQEAIDSCPVTCITWS